MATHPCSPLRRARLAGAAALLAGLLVAPTALSAQPAVLLVGDSWGRFMYTDAALPMVLAAHGHPEIAVFGNATTENGTTAQDWTHADRLQLIADQLTAHPEVEVVVVFLGGNDFLAGQSGGGWYVGISPEAETQLFDDIGTDLAIVIDAILGFDPEIEVVLSSYDYPNFVDTLTGLVGSYLCVPLFDDLGGPTPFEINSVTPQLDARELALAAIRPRLTVVRHWGLMQSLYGFPSDGIEPGDLLPPGDLTLPSPLESMRKYDLFGVLDDDCFHLRPEGYDALAEGIWERALFPRFGGIFLDGFESGTTSAWSAIAGSGG